MKPEVMNVLQFVSAGNALFTVKNLVTCNRFTFKVRRPKNYGDENAMVRFVSVLTGPDNTRWDHYSYIGIIRPNGQFRWTEKSTIKPTAQSVKVFKWFWSNINVLPDFVKVYHEGRCGRCGRRLTVPESIESGFGPECIGMV